MLKRSVYKKAVEITSKFEGTLGYSNVTGNFDGQYMSYGFIQWNFGTGTLQPLFKRLFNEYSYVAQRVLPQGGESLRLALLNGTEKSWVLSKQVNNNFVDPWKTALINLGNTIEMQNIQDDAASAYINQAINLCNKYNLLTDRAFCLMFDIAVQNWSTGSTFVLDPNLSYIDKLKAVVNNVVSKSNTQWQGIVRDRKMAIVNGSGSVYGSYITISGLYDAPMAYDEIMRVNLNTLVNKKIVSSPAYWMENADGNIPCKGEYLGYMIANASGQSQLVDGVNYLKYKGVITSTDYWLANAVLGKTVGGSSAKALINNMATKL